MEICKAEKCTGCGVCADICPGQCISIKYDAHGFYKSYVDEQSCVNCHRCMDVCPANHPYKKQTIQKAYKARRTDKQAAMQSTSGGIASLFSEYIIRNAGIVAGCGFDDDLCLKHSLASDLEELESFKGSKYLQSYTVGIYRKVREQLRTGKTVLFVGTPCQVSALQNYLGKRYDNLCTVDFVCHGVPSRLIFDKYLESLNPTSVPNTVLFRNKTKGYRNKKACFEIQSVYPDRTIRNTTESGIYYWFASSLSVRESCYCCPFVSINRASDITLADYIGSDIDEIDNELGVNTVFVNTDKGMTLLELVKKSIVMEEKSADDMVKRYNRLMLASCKPACRKNFFDELPYSDYQTLTKKYTDKKVLPPKMVRRYYAMKRRLCKLTIRVK